MIHSSKEVLLVSASEGKEFFMFDPKTTAVLHKYRDECALQPRKLYCPLSQQLVAQQTGKTFLSLWNWDAQEADMKISLTQTLTALALSQDGHFLIGGSVTGNIYFWELPSGLLLKKKSLHSSSITHILPYHQNHIITASKTEVKIWAMSALFVEEDNSPPLKQYTSLLDIVQVSENRGIIAVLTHKNLTLLIGSCIQQPRELEVNKKIDFEFATALTLSNTSAFVGDGKGNVDVVQLLQQERGELRFKEKGEVLQMFRGKKRRVLNSSKSPVTCLSFVQSLAYLISGHASGEVIIWSNYQVKKSLHLFKSSIASISVLGKPHQHKITQSAKIRPLHKYQQSKEQQPLQIIIDSIEGGESVNWQHFTNQGNQQQQILQRMLINLKQPEKLLREQISVLREQRSKLVQANLHYFKLLVP